MSSTLVDNIKSHVASPDLTIQTDEKRLCKITFRIRTQLRRGQHVRVLGSDVSLGWDHIHGLVLTAAEPDGASIQEWHGSVKLPSDSTIEYKYVVCEEDTFCYSLSSIRRVFTKRAAQEVEDKDFTRFNKYENLHRSDFVYKLIVQFELPPTNTTRAGQTNVGVTLYNHNKDTLREVIVSTRDSASNTVEASVLSKQLYEVSSFQFTKSSAIKSLHFEVKSATSVLGRGAVLFSQLFLSHHGILATPLLDASFVLVGELVFRYLIVTPFTHPRLAYTPMPLARLPLPTPRSSSTLLCGHRGTGAEGSRKLVEGKVRSHIRENTVLSFTTAGALGAQIVEFDVHLTSDLVPVIYHDFTTHISDADMPIHSMTYEKFCKLGKRVMLSRSTSLEDLKPDPELSPIHDMFPTLRDTLQKVPSTIGFNVEIKYPVEDEIVKYNLRPVNRNIYLDCILWEIYEHAKNRFIVFSSFDPEICEMLAAKQPHYPVFFLTQLGTVIRSDSRSNSVDASIQFALSTGLGGLVCPAGYLVKNPDVIRHIKESGLRLCTWGGENNDPQYVHMQKTMGVDGVIADHVAHIAKHWSDYE